MGFTPRVRIAARIPATLLRCQGFGYLEPKDRRLAVGCLFAELLWIHTDKYFLAKIVYEKEDLTNEGVSPRALRFGVVAAEGQDRLSEILPAQWDL